MIRKSSPRWQLLLAGAVFAAGAAAAPPPTPSATPPTPMPVALPQSAAQPRLPIAPPPSTPGTAWILLDHATGRVLAGHNIHEPLNPASITKVMTSYVLAAEMSAGKVGADDEVFISENAWRQGGAGTDGS